MTNDSERGAMKKGGSRWRLLWRVLASVFLFVAAIEVVFRVWAPRPRFQMIRAEGDRVLESRAGIPVWHDRSKEPRWNQSCASAHPTALKLVLLGSSIFHGVQLKMEETFAWLLQKKLDNRLSSGAVCVMNYAEPGFAGPNKLAVAREVLVETPGAIVVWEAWENDPYPYTFLGDAAYALRHARTDGAGYPDAFGAPAGLNGFLFRHLRAYQYASLTLVPEEPAPRWNQLVETRVLPVLDEVLSLTRASSGTLVVIPAPHLDRPFVDQVHSEMTVALRSWVKKNGVAYHELAELLRDQDVAKVRLDPCCHYNAVGHRLLADRILQVLWPLIQQRTGSR